MDTETLDKMYLEWSQFTRARTAREKVMFVALRKIVDSGATPSSIFDVAMEALTAAEREIGR